MCKPQKSKKPGSEVSFLVILLWMLGMYYILLVQWLHKINAFSFEIIEIVFQER